MTGSENDERRRLKILHIDPERNWGGGEAQVFGLVKFLAANDHQIELAAHPDGALFAKCAQLSIRHHPIVIRNDLDLRCIPALRRKLALESYDIVHFHTKRAHALSLWLPHGGRTTKFLVTRRMDYPVAPNWYTRRLYNQCVDGVVAISQTIADLLIAAGVDARRVRLIPSGIEPKLFASLPPSRLHGDGETVFGSVGVLETRKGHRLAIEALAALKLKGIKVRYRLAGDGNLRQELERQALQLGVSDQVSFAGSISDTSTFLGEIDIFVMPSLFEGLGVAALEAMAAAKPVIASRVGGLAETVVDGETGLLFPAADVSALAAAMATLAGDSQRALALGIKARQRVLQHYTLEQMARRNESLYYELLTASQN
ncbi:MAG TPA: glycosyltransferase family 4 protein [Candidatus Binatia bacterium]